MKKILVILTILLSSCTANYQKIADETAQIAAQKDFTVKIYQTKEFKIYTLQKITNVKKKVRIYFEGDGKAFIQKNVVSPNPTPTSSLLVDLITQDQSPNVVYIARPCQFVEDKKCYGLGAEKYWTDAKFSKEVIDSINEVVADFSDFHIELVGYSGGATIAQHVAAQNQRKYWNILNLRTIAGNLDNETFAQIHGVKQSTDFALDERSEKILSKIPQIHFVGKNDATVPIVIAQNYLRKLPNKNCTKIITVPATNHFVGWKEVWQDLLYIQPECKTPKKKS